MNGMRKRIDKVEAALNPTEYQTIEDILRRIHDPSLPEDNRPLHPDLERAFKKIAEKEGQTVLAR